MRGKLLAVTSLPCRRYQFFVIFALLVSGILMTFHMLLARNSIGVAKGKQSKQLQYEVPGWGKDQSRDTKLYVLPNENTAILKPSNVCKENTPILLLIVITSAIHHFENRKILRETWAKNTNEFNYDQFATIHSNSRENHLPIQYPNWKDFTIEPCIDCSDDASDERFNIRTVFLVGQTNNTEVQRKVIEEAELHDDIIQEQFIESYNNLTLKSLMMLKYVNDNCAGKVKFVMKVDDDIFVNVPNLIHYVLGGTIPVYTNNQNDGLKQFDDVLFGYHYHGHDPIRDKRNKWYMPFYMYESSHYPDFLSGGSYVFSMDAAEKLYRTALETPLLHLEDVYLTGICAEKVRINRQRANNLFSFNSTNFCKARGVITLEELNVNSLPEIYDLVLTSNVSC